MTIRVNGPGFAVNFPDGTDKETIKRVMQEAHAKHQGAQPAQSNAEAKPRPPGTVRLKINGRLVEVSDNFLSMTPEQQDATVDEIAGELAKTAPGQIPPGRSPKLLPVDHDPFAAQPTAGSNVGAKSDRQGVTPDFAKIKRNVQRMIDQNAPEADIDAYVASEGVTAEQLRAAPKLVPVDHNPFLSLPDAAPAPPTDRSFGRGLAIGTQSVGKGLANVAGMPNDLATLILNGLAGGVNVSGDALEALAGWAGRDFEIPDIPRFRSVIGGEQIADMASQAFEAAGGHTIREEEMTPGQQLGSKLIDFGTQAATGAAGLTKAAAAKTAEGTSSLGRMLANSVPNYITNPYKVAPGRMLAGDVAGGVGSGAALEAADEYLPESVAKNPIVRFLASMLGGGAGATTLNVGTSIAKGDPLKPLADMLPAPAAFQDPNATVPVSQRTVDQAIDYVHGNATDPKSALAQLMDEVNFYQDAGGAMPTTGLMTDDTGLQLLDRKMRDQNPKPFMERDKAVRDSASQDVENLRPDNADTFKPRQVSEDYIADRTGAADAAVKAAESGRSAAEKGDYELGDIYSQPPMNREEASVALDKALIGQTGMPMRNTKRDLYDAIDPEGTEMIDTAELVALAEDLDAYARTLPPSLRDQTVPQGIISDIKAYEPKIDPKTGQNVGGPG